MSMQRQWWFCPGSTLLTYGITLICLSYAANLCGAMIRHCAKAYSTKDAHYVTKGTQTTDLTSCPVGVMHTA